MSHKLGMLLESQFVHQMGAMVLCSSLANMERRGDLGIGVSLGRELQNLTLANGQHVLRIEGSRLFRPPRKTPVAIREGRRIPLRATG